MGEVTPGSIPGPFRKPLEILNKENEAKNY